MYKLLYWSKVKRMQFVKHNLKRMNFIKLNLKKRDIFFILKYKIVKRKCKKKKIAWKIEIYNVNFKIFLLVINFVFGLHLFFFKLQFTKCVVFYFKFPFRKHVLCFQQKWSNPPLNRVDFDPALLDVIMRSIDDGSHF